MCYIFLSLTSQMYISRYVLCNENMFPYFITDNPFFMTDSKTYQTESNYTPLIIITHTHKNTIVTYYLHNNFVHHYKPKAYHITTSIDLSTLRTYKKPSSIQASLR